MGKTKAGNPGYFKPGGDWRTKKGQPRAPTKTAIPVLRQFFSILDAIPVSYADLKLDRCRDALCRWRSGKRSPYLVDFWETAHNLGYDIVLVPRVGPRPAGCWHSAPDHAVGTPSAAGGQPVVQPARAA